jgi:hypothetical protein
MSLRRILIATAIPVLTGTLGLTALNSATAANSVQTISAKHNSVEIAQAAQQPNSQQHGQRRPRIDFAAAAAKLGVSEQQLKEALGVPATPPKGANPGQRPPRPDFKAAAG